MPRFKPFDPPRPETDKCPVTGKRMFADEREARWEAERLRGERGVELDAYLCMSCDRWHFSSTSD